MKYVVTFFLFFNVGYHKIKAQSENKESCNSCMTNCWFTMCTKICVNGKTQNCDCIASAWNMCYCSTNNQKDEENDFIIPELKHHKDISIVLRRLKKFEIKEFYEIIEDIFNALIRKDAYTYYKSLQAYKEISHAFPETTKKVEKVLNFRRMHTK